MIMGMSMVTLMGRAVHMKRMAMITRANRAIYMHMMRTSTGTKRSVSMRTVMITIIPTRTSTAIRMNMATKRMATLTSTAMITKVASTIRPTRRSSTGAACRTCAAK